jgi:phage FluMu protein Com
MMDVRCPKCHKLLGRSDGHGTIEIECPRCKHLVRSYPSVAIEIVTEDGDRLGTRRFEPEETKPYGSIDKK